MLLKMLLYSNILLHVFQNFISTVSFYLSVSFYLLFIFFFLISNGHSFPFQSQVFPLILHIRKLFSANPDVKL